MEWRKREECGGRWKVVDLSEMDGKAGYNGRAGTRCALARERRIFRDGARKFCAIRKGLIYKYICRKMIYFAIKTA